LAARGSRAQLILDGTLDRVGVQHVVAPDDERRQLCPVMRLCSQMSVPE
jgi:hypothetical protein